MVAFSRFEALSFDCYGTLIDWEAGIVAALRPMLEARGLRAPDDAILQHFARHEAAVEGGPYRRYREVLGEVLKRIGADHRFEPTPDEIERFGGSVAEWPAFPDSPGALSKLHQRFKLGVITNCDDDLFAASERRLGVTFGAVVTAQQVGAYKPNGQGFHIAFERLGLPKERILHCAQSLFHDHVPAKRLGMTTVWVNRRHGRGGGGATPPAEAQPDLTVPDMKTLADLATA
jgi:2-haloacid dehalogenase